MTSLEDRRMHQVTFVVKGMTCGHCVSAIKSRLEDIGGVLRADVQLKDGRAVVDFDPLKVSVETIADAISDEGYSAERARDVG
jgi:copper chaperone